VRRDGQGDFPTIQQAIDAALPGSLVEIRDDGPYNEELVIPKDKDGLVLRGQQGCWPIITSVGPKTEFPILLRVDSPGVTLQRLVLAHGGAAGGNHTCFDYKARTTEPLRIRACVFFGPGYNTTNFGGPVELDQCVVLGRSRPGKPLHVKDTIWLGRVYGSGNTLENVLLAGCELQSGCRLRCCTVDGGVFVKGDDNALVDCIVQSVRAAKPGTRIEHCNVFGEPPAYVEEAKPGEGCFSAPPQFANQAQFDYRLLPSSPCKGKASDGGDVGCRLTPEMLEMLELALALRGRGVVKF
jgi:hypothetical protein